MGSSWEIAVAWAAIGFLAAAAIVFVLDSSQQTLASFVYSVRCSACWPCPVVPLDVRVQPGLVGAAPLVVAIALSLPGRRSTAGRGPGRGPDRWLGSVSRPSRRSRIGIGLVGTADRARRRPAVAAIASAAWPSCVVAGRPVPLGASGRGGRRRSKAGPHGARWVSTTRWRSWSWTSMERWSGHRTSSGDDRSAVAPRTSISSRWCTPTTRRTWPTAMLRSLEEVAGDASSSSAGRRRAGPIHRLPDRAPGRGRCPRWPGRLAVRRDRGRAPSGADRAADQAARASGRPRSTDRPGQPAPSHPPPQAGRPDRGGDGSRCLVALRRRRRLQVGQRSIRPRRRRRRPGRDRATLAAGHPWRRSGRPTGWRRVRHRRAGDHPRDCGRSRSTGSSGRCRTRSSWAAEQVPVTVSVGLATTDGAVSDPAELLRSADRAMFDAKAEGKNRLVACAEPPVVS